ncbi:MAG: hypothetical protein HY900_36475 [Deltaproteobacteria bacterium]|nr:hypothetical protein [Deltaproteobacteria bacterium]
MEMWNSYANLYREQSEKLLNLWMGQLFEYQKEGQKVFADWLKSVGQTSTDFCKVWEGQMKEAASGATYAFQQGSFPQGQQRERAGEA